MSERNDGGFSVSEDGVMVETIANSRSTGYHVETVGGMPLRDYFAGQALAGYLANPRSNSTLVAASEAYAIADAMLKERAK